MLHEEFERLTGVEVSGRYYREYVEPGYAASATIDKNEYCAEWLKQNKKSLIKVVDVDMSLMTRDIALYDITKSQLDEAVMKQRLTEESIQRVEKDRDRWQELVHSKQEQINEYEKMVAESLELNEQYRKDRDSCSSLELLHKEELAAKDAEIMKLKAMLFDAMYQTA